MARFGGLRVSVGGGEWDGFRLLHNRPPAELVGRVLQSGPPTDLVATAWAGVFLISPRFIKVLTDEGMTGWLASPVAIDEPAIDAELSLLSILGTCGPVFGNGGPPFPGRPPLGSFLHPLRWDGSDVFAATNQQAVYVTANCAERLSAGRLSNLAFEPAGLEELPRAE